MARVILVNGAPGSGKSTVAEQLANDGFLTLALDLDGIKHAMGRWESDATTAGLQARRLALAVAAEQLASGHDIVIGQYLARTEFIAQLEDVARHGGATFHEFVLVVDQRTLASRLGQRAVEPGRPEHVVNARLAVAADAPELVRAMHHLMAERPSAVEVDATGSVDETVAFIRSYLGADT